MFSLWAEYTMLRDPWKYTECEKNAKIEVDLSLHHVKRERISDFVKLTVHSMISVCIVFSVRKHTFVFFSSLCCMRVSALSFSVPQNYTPSCSVSLWCIFCFRLRTRTRVSEKHENKKAGLRSTQKVSLKYCACSVDNSMKLCFFLDRFIDYHIGEPEN